jgi:serine/threonine-protein kinase
MKKRIIFGMVCIGLAAMECAYFYPQLPARVVSHFGANGIPNGWMSREVFLGTCVGTVAFIALIFGVIDALLPKMPTALWNLPNKGYWLAPERKERTAGIVSNALLLIESLTVLFILAVFFMCCKVNLAAPVRLNTGTLNVMLAVFLSLIGISVIAMLVRFSKSGGD